jgi:hypothetical protein
MKRALFVITACALLAGCQHEEHRTSNSGAQAAPAPAVVASTDAAKTAANSVNTTPAKPAAAKEYYEVTKNGKIYVFGNVESLVAFRKSGALPASTIEKPSFGPAGETVVFESGGLEQGLMAEYQKSHPKK